MHEVGKWFANQMDRLKLIDRRLHLRDIHYALLGQAEKPSGAPYTNTDENWVWLQSQAGKAARWLRYVPFGAITDARNDQPVIRIRTNGAVETFVSVEPDIIFPDLEDIEPRVGIAGFTGRQPYRLAFYGEKTSLRGVLSPIADQYGVDLFLPTGEISDTQLHMMAEAAAEDGRKLILFTLCDFDPAGHQMPVSCGRKLQALKSLLFHDLEFEVHPVALTREQAVSLDLPSTPLKETERRADKWRETMGREQTEINALSTLQPLVLREIVIKAIEPFFDYTLNTRVTEARDQWRERAQESINGQLDHDQLASIREAAESQIEDMREKLDDIREMARTATADLDLDLPEVPPVPEPEFDESLQGKPLINSAWSWPEQTKALIARKAYTSGEGS
jgi:hypothetical protein